MGTLRRRQINDGGKIDCLVGPFAVWVMAHLVKLLVPPDFCLMDLRHCVPMTIFLASHGTRSAVGCKPRWEALSCTLSSRWWSLQRELVDARLSRTRPSRHGRRDSVSRPFGLRRWFGCCADWSALKWLHLTSAFTIARRASPRRSCSSDCRKWSATLCLWALMAVVIILGVGIRRWQAMIHKVRSEHRSPKCIPKPWMRPWRLVSLTLPLKEGAMGNGWIPCSKLLCRCCPLSLLIALLYSLITMCRSRYSQDSGTACSKHLMQQHDRKGKERNVYVYVYVYVYMYVYMYMYMYGIG